MFCNSALRTLLPEIGPREAAAKATLSMLAADHPLRQLVERALAGRQSAGPIAVPLGTAEGGPGSARAPAPVPCDRGRARQVPRRDARRAQPRIPQPRPHDAQLFAEAGRARPPDGRRRARGEEPAQRDDDSPRAPEAEAGGDARADYRARRAVRRVADARSDEARQRHRRRDQAARPGRGRVPQVRAARRAEAAARAPGVARQRSHVDDGARSRAPEHRRQGGVPAERARDQRRSGHAAAGAAEPDAQRLPGDARRGHAEADLPGRRRGGASRSTSRTRASASRPRTWAGFSTSTSRPRKRAAVSACRWCSESCSCTTARSRSSPPRDTEPGSGCCFPRLSGFRR